MENTYPIKGLYSEYVDNPQNSKVKNSVIKLTEGVNRRSPKGDAQMAKTLGITGPHGAPAAPPPVATAQKDRVFVNGQHQVSEGTQNDDDNPPRPWGRTTIPPLRKQSDDIL